MPVDMEKCEKLADRLLNDGAAFQYILGVWCNRTKGPRKVGQTFLLSKGSQCVSNSKGLHVQLNGAPGYSKTFLTEQMLALMPEACKWDSDLSDRVLYYPTPEMKDGMVMFIDDIEWRDVLGISVKKTISKFQTGAKSTVVKDMKGEAIQTRKRLVFWVTSVDNQADDQIRDRIFTEYLPSGTLEAKRIIGQMKRLDRKDVTLFNPAHTTTCKYIFADISEQLLDVVIPFDDDEIVFTGDPRAYGVFSDIVKSRAVYNYRIRERDGDSIKANRDDAEAAALLYNAMGGHDPNKFNNSEQAIIDALRDNGNHVTTQELIHATGFTGGRVSQIINGRGKDLQNKNGLRDKCGLSDHFTKYGKVYDLDPTTISRCVSKVSLKWQRKEYVGPAYIPEVATA